MIVMEVQAYLKIPILYKSRTKKTPHVFKHTMALLNKLSKKNS